MSENVYIRVAEPIMITLAEIRAHHPCEGGWETLLKAKGKTKADDEPFPLSDILETNDLDDCLWALRCTPETLHPLWRKFAVWAARQVEHLMEDERSKKVLEVAWRYANGAATNEELGAAWDAARNAAWDAARAAARAAAGAAAGTATRAAAWNAAWDAALDAQAKKLKQILDAGEWVK